MAEGGPRPGEFDLIARYFAPLARDPAARGLVDDAAVLIPPPGRELVLTKDALAANIHFFSTDDPQDVAEKALSVNLSDLAAKGADPLGYLLAIALPSEWTEEWIAGFSTGLAANQDRYGWSLLGGDTIRSPNGLMVSVTAIGAVPTGESVSRAGARPGDVLFVSGTLGDAAFGLKLRAEEPAAEAWSLSETDKTFLIDRYLHPQPRVALAAVIREYASAAMDISDGLTGDLAHICEASGISAELRLADMPISEAGMAVLAVDPDEIHSIIAGGDDYEILAAIPPDRADRFKAAAAEAGVPVAAIGTCTEQRGDHVTFLDSGGMPVELDDTAFRHF
ncbi:MAG: thiamine-phosphate kinase [Hyphomicrobiales bacterium]|mgnify:CR=1 FL=1|nr:MAG: thiamine-phosphate kinase [Hyphomicrobiales bacterium]